jgi:hypothetical protein
MQPRTVEPLPNFSHDLRMMMIDNQTLKYDNRTKLGFSLNFAF